MNKEIRKAWTDRSASGTDATSGTAKDQLRLFVSMLTIKVLNKCGAFQNFTYKQWNPHVKHIINQTMEGLDTCRDVLPDKKSTKKTRNAVVKDLQKAFQCKRLEFVAGSQTPDVDAVIVQALQTRIKELFDRLENYNPTERMSADAMKLILLGLGAACLIFLLAFLFV